MAEPRRPTRSLSTLVAIVTGAGSKGTGIGNGRAAAILLAEAGANVVCVDLSSEDASRTVQMIEEDGKGKGIAITADITDENQCKSIVEQAVKEFGRVDILVNNVGIMGPKGTAVDVDMVEWEKAMRINVSSMVMMAKYCIPAMIENEGQQCRGSIVNLGSVAGLRGGTPSLLYPTAKGAVVNLTRAMAVHHASDGIRVNCVCPGMLYTPMMYGGGMTDEQREARKNRSLLKTEGNGWDCGAAVRFLAGDEARWITGLAMPVDAGTTASTVISLPSNPYSN